MKKTRMLALALVVMVMLMGAGYAAWTDKLTINTTVETGELNIDFTTATLAAAEKDTVYQVFQQPVVSEDKKQVTLTVANMYPGAGINFKATFINNGTIPAVLYGIALTDEPMIAPTYNGKTLGLMSPDDKKLIDVTGTLKFDGNQIPVPANTTLDNLGTVLGTLNGRLESTKTVELDITLTPNKDSINGNILENKYANFKIVINAKQHNI